MSDIPEWAKERAVSMANAEAGFAAWHSVEPSFGMRAFARYIAEHEEPPVDPLLIEAQRIVAHSPGFTSRADAIFAGKLDNDLVVRMALAALKRGMELAREAKP